VTRLALAVAVAVAAGGAAPGIARAAAPAAEAAAPPSYAAGNQAYKEGRWGEAIRNYEGLVAAGLVNPDLHYNLGNAYFRDGQLGRAIYHYQRALTLDPDLADAGHNLTLARKLASERWSDRIEGAARAPLWARVVTALSLRSLAWIFLICDLVLFAGLVGRRLRRPGSLHTGLGVAAAGAGVGMVLAGVLLAGHVWRTEGRDVGVVLDDEVGVRESSDEGSVARAVVHGGLEVEITSREPGWLRIELPNRVEGWVPATTVGEL